MRLRLGLALDEVRHAGAGEGNDAVLGCVDEALGDQLGAGVAEAVRPPAEPGGNLAGGAAGVTVGGHRSQVPLFRAGGAVPAGAKEAVVKGYPPHCGAEARRGV